GDALDKSFLSDFVNEKDLIVLAVPGFMGFKTLELLINLKKNVVDISFFPENALLLNKAAKSNQEYAAVDCGIAPSYSSMIGGYHYNNMNIEKYVCKVGGLPFERIAPFEYKAPFSPIDVIEEYTRPARIKRNGEILTLDPLSEIENFEEK